MTGPPPDIDEIAALARTALLSIPAELRDMTDGILFRVEEFPDEEMCADMALDSPFDLLGLYQGVDLTQRGFNDGMGEPDVIWLFRRPLLDYWCETGEDLAHLVRHVVIHEIGHHFGLSDEDMEALEASVPD